MDAFDFYPPSRVITIKKQRYELGAVTFNYLRRVKSHFGSLENFEKLLKTGETGGLYEYSYVSTFGWASYNLIISEVKRPLNKFIQDLVDDSKNYVSNIKEIYGALEDSYPRFTSNVSKTNNDSNISFSKALAYVASKTGMSIKDVYNLTPRQLVQLQEDLASLDYQRHEFDAALHGCKLPKNTQSNQPVDFTPEEESELMLVAEQLAKGLTNGKNKA